MTTAQATAWAAWRALHVLKVGGLLLVAVLLGLPLGERLEQAVWPVVAEAAVSDVTRDGQTLCWTLAYDKRRDVAPTAFFLIARSDSSALAYSVLAWDVATGSAERGRIMRRPVGRGARRLCVDLPPSMARATSVTIESSMVYDVGARPWTTIVSFPPVQWRATPPGR